MAPRILTLVALAAVPAAAGPVPPKAKPKPAAKRPAPAPASKPAAPKPAPAPEDPEVISTGPEAVLVDHLRAEGPTAVIFYQPANQDDRDFLDLARKHAAEGGRLALRRVPLTSLMAPIALQYEVTSTPTVFVYDRNKNLVGRAQAFGEIGDLVRKASRVARLKWVNEDDPRAPEVYRMMGGGRAGVPEIMKTMSLHPEAMEAIAMIAQRYHFRDGYLPRRTKEMIASYVSALNKCKY